MEMVAKWMWLDGHGPSSVGGRCQDGHVWYGGGLMAPQGPPAGTGLGRLDES